MRRWTSILRWLRPEEWMCGAFGLLLYFLAVCCTGPDYGWPGLLATCEDVWKLSARRELPFFSSHMAFFLLVAIVTYAAFLGKAGLFPGGRPRLRLIGERNLEFLNLVRSYIPFLACYAVYALLRDVIPHLRRNSLDISLAQMEVRWFGTLACTAVYHALESDLATEWLSWAYASHFYAPPLVAFLLYMRRDFRRFRDFMLAITISAFIAYAGYLLVPVVGPRYAFPEWDSIRAAQSGNPTLMFVDAWGRASFDCFPSLHTAWTVLTAITLFQVSKPLFAVYLPVGLGLILACLYFGYHYGVDLPAGALAAVVAFSAALALHRWWYARVRDLSAASADISCGTTTGVVP